MASGCLRRGGGSERSEGPVGQDVAEIEIDEGHEPAAVGLFANTDMLAGESGREIEATTKEGDRALGANAKRVVVARVFGFEQLRWMRA